MKALSYEGPGMTAWSNVPMPGILEPTDVVVKVDLTTICDSDLHILRGDVPGVSVGRILGHEAVGTVTEVGSGVRRVRTGDRVLVSCITVCGTCEFCQRSHFARCVGGGGWILGHLIDGTQAEYVRVPFADTSTFPVPDGVSDEKMLMIADILPTAYEAGVLSGTVHPGDVVVVLGAGPVGLATIATATMLSPECLIAIDVDETRLAMARQFGADVTLSCNGAEARSQVMALSGGLGAHVAIDAMGLATSFELALSLVRSVSHVANIGAHAAPVPRRSPAPWSDDITVTTGTVDAFSTPTLIRLVKSGQIAPDDFITHRLSMDEMLAAYELVEHAGQSGAIKVALAAAARP